MTELLLQDAKLTVTKREVEIFLQYINSPDYCFDKEYLNKHNAKIDLKLSLVLAHNRSAFTEKFKEINDAKNAVANKFIQEDKVDSELNVKDEFMAEWNEAMESILSETVEIDIKAINMDYLVDNDYPISESDLGIIGCIIYIPQPPVENNDVEVIEEEVEAKDE